MPGFDKNLDKELFSKSIDFERSMITVAVFSYNNGTPKLQISRENKNASGELQFAKLGRMTRDEVANIIPFMKEAEKFL